MVHSPKPSFYILHWDWGGGLLHTFLFASWLPVRFYNGGTPERLVWGRQDVGRVELNPSQVFAGNVCLHNHPFAWQQKLVCLQIFQVLPEPSHFALSELLAISCSYPFPEFLNLSSLRPLHWVPELPTMAAQHPTKCGPQLSSFLFQVPSNCDSSFGPQALRVKLLLVPTLSV